MALMDFRDGRGEARSWIFLETIYSVVPELCHISLAGCKLCKHTLLSLRLLLRL